MSHRVLLTRKFQNREALRRACERKEVGCQLVGDRITGKLYGTVKPAADGTFQIQIDNDYRRSFQTLESLYDIECAKLEAEAQNQSYEEVTEPDGTFALAILVEY